MKGWLLSPCLQLHLPQALGQDSLLALCLLLSVLLCVLLGLQAPCRRSSVPADQCTALLAGRRALCSVVQGGW